jgi:mono/diheme cytochrome c family protein
MKKSTIATLAVSVTVVIVVFSNVMKAAGGFDGQATFKAKCASCHGADASGNTPVGKSLKIRDLRSAEVQSQSDDELFNTIAKGKGKMPGYEKSLGAEQIHQLVTFIREQGTKN